MAAPGLKVSILTFNEVRVATKFTNMADALVFTKPIMNEVADYIIDRAAGKFQSEGRAGGGSWKQLSRKWLKFKLAHGFSSRILQKKGALSGAFSQRKAPHQILNIEQYTMKVGVDLPYGASMQFGDSGRGIPARPYLVTNQAQREVIRRMIRDYILKEFNGV